MKKVSLTILLLFICSFDLFAQTDAASEQYAVYDAVLQSRFQAIEKDFGVKPAFVVSAETMTLDFNPSQLMSKKSLHEFTSEKLAGYPKDLSDDFKVKNQVSIILEKRFPAKYEYHLVAKSELDKLLEEGEKEEAEFSKKCVFCSWGGFVWQPLKRKYPNSTGYSRFSRVGFGADKNSAVVFINSETAGHGESMFYLLEKSNDQWKVKERVWTTSWST